MKAERYEGTSRLPELPERQKDSARSSPAVMRALPSTLQEAWSQTVLRRKKIRRNRLDKEVCVLYIRFEGVEIQEALGQHSVFPR